MIVLDTHVLVRDAIDPARLSSRARDLLDEGEASGSLACSDISLWEVAMLLAHRRIEVDAGDSEFIERLTALRNVVVLPITPPIAVKAQSTEFRHGDPADRIIAATAMVHRARLVSADARLRKLRSVQVLW